MNQLKAPSIPPWATSLLQGGRRPSASSTPDNSVPPGSTSDGPLSLPSVSWGDPSATAPLQSSGNSEPAGTDFSKDIPGRELDVSTPASSSAHVPTTLASPSSPSPAQIVSDIVQPGTDALNSSAAPSAYVPVDGEPMPLLKMSIEKAGKKGSPASNSRNGFSSAEKKASFSASSKMKALQSVWEKSSRDDGAYTARGTKRASPEVSLANKRRSHGLGPASTASPLLAGASTKSRLSQNRVSEQDLMGALRTARSKDQSGSASGIAGPELPYDANKSQSPVDLTDPTPDLIGGEVTPQVGYPSKAGTEEEEADHEDAMNSTAEADDYESSIPSLVAHEVDGVVAEGVVPLAYSGDGRPYSMLWIGDNENIQDSASGGIFPTNYELMDDPVFPFVCPVRDCRALTTNMHSMGSHMNAKHRRTTYNDNSDGTLTKVGTYQSAGGKSSPPIVISIKRPSIDEPPPVTPWVSYHTKRLVEKNAKTGAVTDRYVNGIDRLRRRRRSRPNFDSSRGISEDQSQAWDPVIPEVEVDDMTESTDHSEDSELYDYLEKRLPVSATIPRGTGKIPDLLAMPRRRDLPANWRPKRTGANENWNPSSIASLLLYLTGDVTEGSPCLSCQQPDNVWPECVVAPKNVPSLHGLCKGSCAACWFKCNFARVRNTCSFLGEKPVIPRNNFASKQAEITKDKSAQRGPESPTWSPGAEESGLSTMPVKPRQQRHSAISANKAFKQTFQSRSQLADARTQPARSDAVVNAGNPMSADVLEMEEWEVAPGRIRDESGPAPENIAFSNSYLSSNQAIPISSDVSFNVVTLKPGGSTQWREDGSKLRVCSLATGKVQVKMEGAEFVIGPNGMFKVRAGMECTVQNRLYIDATLHISTISET